MPVDQQLIRQYVPMNELTGDNLRELANKTEIETYPIDTTLFKRGDNDQKSIYILAGQAIIMEKGGKNIIIEGGKASSRFPIGHKFPREARAQAQTEIKILRIDNSLLDMLLSLEKSHDTSNQDEDDDDWMSRMIQSPIFQKLPPSSIQQVFMRLETVEFKKDDVIIRQGDDGDYYYYIVNGTCSVTVEGKSGKVIKLAELKAGTGFGEDALVSDNKRNASVTMLSDGSLARLSKVDFEELLKNPVLHAISFAEAKPLIQEGGVQMIDVRLDSEFKKSNIRGSVNIPLHMIRAVIPKLAKGKHYITVCDTGKRSASAAFILNESNIECHYIRGGMMGIKQELQQKS